MSIFGMIDLIRRRPGMYLGRNSISALRNFLDGYRAAEREHSLNQIEELFPLPFSYMHEYTAYRLHERNSMGWSHQLLKACDDAEDIALQKFFEFYDGFIRVRMKGYLKAVLTEDNITYHNQMKGGYSCSDRSGRTDLGLYTLDDIIRQPLYPDPLAVYVIELTIPVYIIAVETDNDIQLNRWFFPSLKQAIRQAESNFSPIASWEEYTARNISFGKNIVP